MQLRCYEKFELNQKSIVRREQIRPTRSGGGERARTDDLLRARQALSQLSYTPPRFLSAYIDDLGRWWA